MTQIGNKLQVDASVTTFGKISPLRKNLKKSFWPFLESPFNIWQNYEPNLANISYFWAKFHCSKWPYIKKRSSHLVTLVDAASKISFKTSFLTQINENDFESIYSDKTLKMIT